MQNRSSKNFRQTFLFFQKAGHNGWGGICFKYNSCACRMAYAPKCSSKQGKPSKPIEITMGFGDTLWPYGENRESCGEIDFKHLQTMVAKPLMVCQSGIMIDTAKCILYALRKFNTAKLHILHSPMKHSKKDPVRKLWRITIWLFNIAMENPNHKWRFIAGKIIYKWAIYTMANC